MSRATVISKAELYRLADAATARNVQVEIERGGTIIRVSPFKERPTVDDGEESALDRELDALKVKHGYS